MWVKEKRDHALNLDNVVSMSAVFIQSGTIGNHWTIRCVTNASTLTGPKTYDMGQYEEESEARDWIDAFVAKHGEQP